MGAPKRTLPPALAANRWRPGQSGNPLGHSGEYSEAMRLARQAAPGAVRRLRELAELDRLDERGNLIPLSELPDADRRVVAVACNALLDRAFGKPKEPSSEPGPEVRPMVEKRIDWESLSNEQLDAIEAFALASQKRRHQLEQDQPKNRDPDVRD